MPIILGYTPNDNKMIRQKILSALKKKGKCIKLIIIKQKAEKRKTGKEHR